MLEIKEEPLVFLRYGLSRKKDLLRDFKVLYDGIVVPANILLYQYKGTPAIVYRCEQPFFVDPMSYLFAHPLNEFKKRIEKGNNKFKPSFSKLVQGYGENPDYFLKQDYNTLVEYLIRNDNKLIPFIKNCIDFQWETINETINKSKDLLPEGAEVNLRPTFIIPPYFAYRTTDGTTELNLKIIKYCWETYNNSLPKLDIFPMLFIEKENLNADFIESLKKGFNGYDFPGYCIWIDEFDEREVTSDEIKGLISLINIFSNNKSKQIVLLYGGFFSMLLFKYGITSICHGIAYSESKSINAAVKQTGGGAPVRYYIPDLHQFLTIENALPILRERPDLICNCPICQRIVQSDPENITRFQQEEELAELHFLYNRNKEKSMVGKLNKEDIPNYLQYIANLNGDIDKITKKYKTYYGYEDRPIIKSDYISEWKKAFESTLKA